MNKANNEGNYDYIKGFYRYKVCDSIIELDINNRIKKQDNEKKKIKELKLIVNINPPMQIHRGVILYEKKC